MFCAHIDTVPHRGQIEVVDDDGVFRSRGETILGADNKAAVAVFMELVARHARGRRRRSGSSCSSPSPRSRGCAARRPSTPRRCARDCGFVLDHAGAGRRGDRRAPRPSRRSSPTSPGSRPTPGSSPRTAAARSPPPPAAIARMELGRLDEETTANVGLIEGGTSGNVVPGHCRIARRGAQPRRRAGGRGRRARWPTPAPGAPSEHGCDVDVRIEELFRGYQLPKRLARAGASPRRGCAAPGSSRCGSRPAAAATPTRCCATGFDCVLLANGTDGSTPPDEMRRRPRNLERCSRSARGSSSRPPRPGRA